MYPYIWWLLWMFFLLVITGYILYFWFWIFYGLPSDISPIIWQIFGFSQYFGPLVDDDSIVNDPLYWFTYNPLLVLAILYIFYGDDPDFDQIVLWWFFFYYFLYYYNFGSDDINNTLNTQNTAISMYWRHATTALTKANIQHKAVQRKMLLPSQNIINNIKAQYNQQSDNKNSLSNIRRLMKLDGHNISNDNRNRIIFELDRINLSQYNSHSILDMVNQISPRRILEVGWCGELHYPKIKSYLLQFFDYDLSKRVITLTHIPRKVSHESLNLLNNINDTAKNSIGNHIYNTFQVGRQNEMFKHFVDLVYNNESPFIGTDPFNLLGNNIHSEIYQQNNREDVRLDENNSAQYEYEKSSSKRDDDFAFNKRRAKVNQNSRSASSSSSSATSSSSSLASTSSTSPSLTSSKYYKNQNKFNDEPSNINSIKYNNQYNDSNKSNENEHEYDNYKNTTFTPQRRRKTSNNTVVERYNPFLIK